MRFREKISRNEYKNTKTCSPSVSQRRYCQLHRLKTRIPSSSWRILDRRCSWVLHQLSSSLAAETSKADPPNGNQVITAPEPWKALGDELIFVAEVIAMEDLPPLLNAFRTSTQAWNREFLKQRGSDQRGRVACGLSGAEFSDCG